jgi:electron-transferring-flavoprotein dehydrogenase
LTKQLVKKFKLDEDRNPQVYAVGVKEVWDVPKEKNTGGRVIHTMGWPLRNEEFGGGFIYNMADGRVSIGLVVGLDYLDPAGSASTISTIQNASLYQEHLGRGQALFLRR